MEISSGNLSHQKGLVVVKEILGLMDENEKGPNKSKNKDKLMELIYEVTQNVKFVILSLLASRTRRPLGFINRRVMVSSGLLLN